MVGALRLTLSGVRDVVAVSTQKFAEAMGAGSQKLAKEVFGRLDEQKLRELRAAGLDVFSASVPKAPVFALHKPWSTMC